MIPPNRLNHWISYDFEYALMYFDNALQSASILHIARDLEVLRLFLQLTVGQKKKKKVRLLLSKDLI